MDSGEFRAGCRRGARFPDTIRFQYSTSSSRAREAAISDSEVEKLIEERTVAKKSKNFAPPIRYGSGF